MTDPFGAFASALAGYAVKKGADRGLSALIGMWNRHQRRLAFKRAFAVAANATAARHAEISVELFSPTHADRLRAFVSELAENPANPPPIEKLSRTFFSEHFPRLSGAALNSAVLKRYRRPIGDVRLALSLFYDESLRAFAAEPLLRQEWRDQTLRQTLEQASRAATASQQDAQLKRIGPALDGRLRIELRRLRRRQGFPPFDVSHEINQFAKNVEGGEYSLADNSTRAEALTFSAQSLARIGEASSAVAYRALAVDLGAPVSDTVFDAWMALALGDADKANSIAAADSSPRGVSLQLRLRYDQDGAQGVVREVEERRLVASELSGGGVCLVAAAQQEMGKLTDALAFAKAASENHYEDAPWLHAQRGLLHLLIVADPGWRVAIESTQLPIDPEGLFVKTDPAWQGHLEQAYGAFRAAQERASEVGAVEAARLYEEFAFIAALEHPTLAAVAKHDLSRLMADADRAPRLAHIANAFDVPFDRARAIAALDNAARLRTLTSYEVRAMLALLNDPAAILRFLRSARNAVIDALGQQNASLVEVEMLVKSGNVAEADNLLAKLRPTLPEIDAVKLEALIASTKGTDPTAALIAHFAQTDRLHDLRTLVEALHAAKRWEQLADYSARLFRRTGEARDLQNLCAVLDNLGRAGDAWRILTDAWPNVEHTKALWRTRAVAAFRAREFAAAREALSAIGPQDAIAEDWRIAAMVAVESGAWANIRSAVRAVVDRPGIGPPDFLLWFANLAVSLDMKDEAMSLAERATEGASQDPNVLLGAHIIAMKLDREDTEQARTWFERAFALSDESGPIQQKSIKDLSELAPQWAEQTNTISREWLVGTIPMFVAAGPINSNIVDLVLGRALQITAQPDPRKRGIISAFFGNGRRSDLSTLKSLGLDVTALMTLRIAECLDEALSLSPRVVLPAWTLSTLFAASHEIRFHQPSRVKRAEELRALAEAGLVTAFTSRPTGPELADEVGIDLAGMLEEAERTGGCVVRPAPLHRSGSLLEIEVPLADRSQHVVDLRGVLAALLAAGAITEQKAASARPILDRLDRGWGVTRDIDFSRPVYLDALAADYLQSRNLLRTLADAVRAANSTLYVEERVVTEARELLQHDQTTVSALTMINDIRSTLEGAIRSGTAFVAAERPGDDEDIVGSPTGQVVLGALEADCIVIDDRAINRHAFVGGSQSRPVQIVTTLDLLDTLRSKQRITDAAWRDARHKLRAAGFLFIPLYVDEIKYWLGRAQLDQSNQLVESAELRSIRESIQRALLVVAPILPAEGPVFQSWRLALLMAVRGVWNGQVSAEQATARANWCVSLLPDPRDMGHLRASAISEEEIDQELAQNAVYMTIGAPAPHLWEAFAAWGEDIVAAPLAERRPRALALCVAAIEDILSRTPSGDANE